nr:hypothetical protein [Tanacetum cinerariifolium]
MCDKKNSVLFTETECLVLSPNFMLLDESQVVLRVPRQSNMYSFDLQNVVPSEDLTCLFAKASIDESNLGHMRLGYVNFKTMNKLVKENLVSGLPSKIFNNDHSCVACQKGKQHKATYKAKLVRSISQPLQMLRMDLLGPSSIISINHNKYCLVVTDDFSRDLDEFCGIKEIKKEYSNARTPQQNGVAERKNKTLIKAARIILADSLLLVTFWVEAINTACYVLNRALVTRTHNKTPYELLNGRSPRLNFMRPFSCPATILNTLDPLGKFEGKADEGFLVGYSITSKAFRIFNTKTKKVKENLHVRFLKNKPNVAETGPNWLFDIDSSTNSMNYIPVSAGNQTDKKACPQDTNGNAGTQDNVDTGKEVSDQYYIVFPLWSSISSIYKSSDDKPTDDKPKDDTGFKTVKEPVNKEDQAYRDELDRLMSQEKEASNAADALRKEFEQGCMDQKGVTQVGSTNSFNTVSNLVNAASTSRTLKETAELQSTGIFNSAYDHDLDIYTSSVQSVGTEADFNNMESSTIVSPIPTHKVHIYHPKDQILRDPKSAVQTKGMAKKSYGAHAFEKDDIMLVQVYVDDIMFGSTKKSLCDEFEALVHKRFPMSSMGELTFFLGLHVTQSEEGIFISQDKPDIMLAVCACSRFQVTPKLSHLQAMKRIFRYLKGQPKLGLWYPRDSPFDLEAYSDSDYAGANLNRKSIIRVNSVKQIHVIVDGKTVVISESSVISDILFNDEDGIACLTNVEIFTATHPTISHELQTEAHIEQILPSHSTYQRKHKKTHKPRKAKKVTKLPQTIMTLDIGANEVVHQEQGDSVERAITTDAILVAAQDGDRPRRQETTLGVQMLILGHTPGSDEGRPNLLELMNIYTKFSNEVLTLEEAKATQDKVITILKLRVRRLEKKKTRTSQPMKRRLFKGGVETSTDKSLEDKGSGEKGGSTVDQVSTTRPEVSVATPSTPPITTTIFGHEDLTIPQILIKIRKFDEIQAIMDADHELAVRMRHEEQKIYTIEERERLLAEYFERRKKQLAAERVEAIRNKPPTRTQVRNRMITYLKHMGTYTHQ